MKSSADARRFSRREFLWRSVKAGIMTIMAGSLSICLYDPKGPGRRSKSEEEHVILPNFSVPERGGRMSIIFGSDRAKTVRLGLKAIGGIARYIGSGDKVLIKVNAAFATPPALSATTHPQLVSEIARLCFKAGASRVIVTDNPINDPQSCFSLSGIGEASRSVGAEVILPEARMFKPTTVPGASLIKKWPLFYGPFEGITKVIGIAPVKDHHRAGASMTMKNWYGLLGGKRNLFHQNIHDCISELAVMVRPTLVILDGTWTMMNNGPTGGSFSDLKDTHTMIVSTDQVAADAFGATLLGRTLPDLPYILKAQAAGAGTADYEALNPVRVQAG